MTDLITSAVAKINPQTLQRPSITKATQTENIDVKRQEPAADEVSITQVIASNTELSEQKESKSSLIEITEQLNLGLERASRGLRFNVDEASGITVINVVDTETDEVLRQIPPESVLKIAEKLNELEESFKNIDSVGIDLNA